VPPGCRPAPAGQARVEAQGAVGEFAAAGAGGVLQEHPQDGPGQALDEVVLAQKDAVVAGEVTHLEGRAGGRGGGGGRFGQGKRFLFLLRRGVRAVGLEGQAELGAEGDQGVFQVVAEVALLPAFHVEHRLQAVATEDRDGHLAGGLGQAGGRDGRFQVLGEALGTRLLADRPPIAVFGGGKHDADGHPFAGGDADHAGAIGDLRARAGTGIAPAAHQEELGGGLVGHEQHLLLDAEVAVQAVGQGGEQGFQAAAGGQGIGAAAERRQQGRAAGGGRQLAPRHRLHRQHPVHVRPLQAEYPGHAGMGGDAGELGLHALEERPGGLGAQVAQAQPVTRHRLVIDHQCGGVGVGQDVLAGLVEELEGQRHMRWIHVHQLGDVGDVGHAVRPAGGQGGRHHALQAVADGVHRDIHAVPRSRRSPAPGPGVWP